MGLKYHDGTKFREVSPVTLIFPADAGAGLLNVTEAIIHEVGDLSAGISAYAFQSFQGLTSLTLPAGMTGNIGNYAFYGCTTLTSLTLNSPTLVPLPNVNAFTNCPANIYVPAGLVSAYKAAANWSTLAARIFAI